MFKDNQSIRWKIIQTKIREKYHIDIKYNQVKKEKMKGKKVDP